MNVITAGSRRAPSPKVPDTDRAADGSPLIARVAIVLAVLPLVVSAVWLFVHVGSGFHAVSDNAVNELRTRDIGRHLVLLGPYSRDGWNHPGPAMYYLYFLPYWLSGGQSIGLALAALLVNAGAIIGIALVARRLGGAPLLLLVLIGCGLVVRASGADFMFDPWNPYVTVLPFGLLLMLTWALTCGEAWALPAAAAVASFCVQTHIGYAPLAIPPFVGGAVWVTIREWRARRTDGPSALRPRQFRRWAMIAVAILVVMWLPPLLDQVLHSPGNLGKTFDYFRHPSDPAHSLVEGYRVVTAQFDMTPEWIVGAKKPGLFSGEPDFIRSSPAPLLLVPFVAAALVLWRRRAANGSRLAVTVAVGLCLGVLAVARTTGPVYVYRLRWTWVLAMIATVVVAWTAWMLWSGATRRGLEARWLVSLSLSALVVLAGVNTVGAATAGTPYEPESGRMSRLIPPVMAALPATRGDVIIRGTSFSASGYASGLVLALERRNVTARVEGTAHGDLVFGSNRVHRRAPVRAVLYVAVDQEVQPLATRRDLRLVAYQGKHPLRERARLAEQDSALATEYKAGTIDARDYYRKAAALADRLGFAVAVFMATLR